MQVVTHKVVENRRQQWSIVIIFSHFHGMENTENRLIIQEKQKL